MKYSYIAKSLAKHARAGFKLPYMVMFETTLMCNMFCEYCIFGEEGKFNDLQLPIEGSGAELHDYRRRTGKP